MNVYLLSKGSYSEYQILAALRYLGQVTTDLHEHEPGTWDDDCAKLGCRKDVRAWHFEDYEIPEVYDRGDKDNTE